MTLTTLNSFFFICLLTAVLVLIPNCLTVGNLMRGDKQEDGGYLYNSFFSIHWRSGPVLCTYFYRDWHLRASDSKSRNKITFQKTQQTWGIWLTEQTSRCLNSITASSYVATTRDKPNIDSVSALVPQLSSDSVLRCIRSHRFFSGDGNLRQTAITKKLAY